MENQLGNSSGISKYREEYIRDWIETEILFQISKENKLLNRNNYENILEVSGKELGASIAINEYLQTHPIAYTEKDLKDYFDNHNNDFSFSQEAYILNYVSFIDEESAINFRNKAISEGWQSALDNLESDDELLINQQNQVFKLSEIQSKKIIRVLQKLFNNEISLVIETELNNFVVVQQIDKIDGNTVPKFDFVKKNVKKSYLVYKQRAQIKNYIDSLVAHRSVKIY